MEKIALFPGSFDPFTVGHESIVKRSLQMFDKIIIAIGNNSTKPGFMNIEKRKLLIEQTFKNNKNIEIEIYTGLTIEYCRQKNIKHILRGLRTSADFEYERAIAQVNKSMFEDLETVFLLTLPEHTAISSTIVREIIRYDGNARRFLPSSIDYNYFFGK